MVEKHKKRKQQQIYGMHPIDQMAARGMGKSKKKKPSQSPGKLRAQAAKATDPKQKQKLLQKAKTAENLIALKRVTEKKLLTGSDAINKAKRDLEASAWRRKNK